MNKQDVDKMLELHHRDVRVERKKTALIILLLRLCGVSALSYVFWLSFFPVPDEERFFSAACKYDAAELPSIVRSACSAIKAWE